MCQMSVVMDKNGLQEKVLDEVTRLEFSPDGVLLSTFFDEPKLIPGVGVKEIDFIATTVTLRASETKTED